MGRFGAVFGLALSMLSTVPARIVAEKPVVV